MFTKISSITLAILLFLVLYGARDNLYIALAGTAGMIIAALAVNIKRLNFTWPHLLLPTIYLAGVGGVFVLIMEPVSRIVFLSVAALIFYLLEVRLGKESHFLQNVFLLSVFACYLGFFAGHYYLRVSSIFLVGIIFAATYLFALQGFAGFTLPAKKYFYFILALICAQAAWGLSLWPTHYFVDAAVLFCIFYIIWLFAFSAFFGKLNLAKISWQILLVFIVLTSILSTAAWQPLR